MAAEIIHCFQGCGETRLSGYISFTDKHSYLALSVYFCLTPQLLTFLKAVLLLISRERLKLLFELIFHIFENSEVLN